MSIAVVGIRSSYEFRWRRWALARDTASVLIEPAALPTFRAVGDALMCPVRVDAHDLKSEVELLQRKFEGRSTDLLAISEATASVLYMGVQVPALRPLSTVERSQVAPITPGADLASYFASLFDSMLDVCQHPFSDGAVEALDA